MPVSSGIIVSVQESRFRMRCDDGRWRHLMLGREAPIEPQDLGPLVGRKVLVRWRDATSVRAQVALDIASADLSENRISGRGS